MGAVKYWNEPRIVANYAAREHLYPPEATLLSDLSATIHEMDMLDIAVGAGRTTFHFAPKVYSYVGIDRSRRMIDACRFSADNGGLPVITWYSVAPSA